MHLENEKKADNGNVTVDASLLLLVCLLIRKWVLATEC